TRKPRATRHDLLVAVEEVLAGKAVTLSVTEAPGCPLPQRSRNKKPTVRVTYRKDVAAILQRRCVGGPRKGGSGPFVLTSFRDAADWSAAIREVVTEGRMPPWGANPKHGTFANDPSLTAPEKKTLFAWIDAGCPEGDRRQLTPLPPRSLPKGW